MSYIVSLTSNKQDFIELPLCQFVQSRQISNKSVIQSNEYVLQIEIDDENVEGIIITIGNISYKLEKKYKGIYNLKKRFFNCIWGYTTIIVELLKNDCSQYYYSELLEVLLSSSDNKSIELEESLNLMVKYIIDKNVLLLHTPVWGKISIIDKSLKKSTVRTLRTEVGLLEEIIECYKKNMGYFMCDLKYQLINKNKLENFENVSQINLDTINYIISHPEELYSVNYETGIKIYNQNYIPKKTLTTKNCTNHNIYENKAILGFILSLTSYVQEKIEQATSYLKKCNSSYSIRKVRNQYYIWYIQHMKDILINLEILYYQYKQIMRCEAINVTTLCLSTNIFLNYAHYRQVYINMQKWFEGGNYNFIDDNVMSYLLSTDQIYEYYCLLNLIDNIIELGFCCAERERRKYAYPDCNYSYLGNNTFEFTNKNEDLKITLYYQPIYYSDKFENNITLFRTSKDNKNKESWYSPDFIIKVNANNQARYIILDAKWQERKTIENYAFKDIIYKYVFSVEVCENSVLCNVCILQGRDDNKTIYNHQTGQLSIQMGIFSQPKVSIIPFTPRKHSNGHILQMLREVIWR